MILKYIKYIMLLLPLICILLLATACGDRASIASARLSSKYNKNFVIKKVFPQKIGQEYYEVKAYPEDDPEVLFDAVIDTKDDNFSDNYVARVICKKITNEIYKNLNTTDNIYIFVDASGPQPYTDNPEISIYDYISLDSLNKIGISIFATKETDDLYNANILFSNIDYIDMSARVYIVNEEKLQEIKTYLSDSGKIDSYFMELVEKVDFKTIKNYYN